MKCTNPECGKEFEPIRARKQGRYPTTCSPECARAKQLQYLRDYKKGIRVKKDSEKRVEEDKADRIRSRYDFSGNNFNAIYC